MVAKRFLVVILVLLFAAWLIRGCGGSEEEVTIRVGRDSSWYPLPIKVKAKNVLAFSDDLLRQTAEDLGVRVQLLTASTDTIISDLRNGEYDLILSPMEPSEESLGRYDLSSLYFATGPVLVVPIDSPISSIQDLVGKSVGVERRSQSSLALVRGGLIAVTPFDNMVIGLESLIRGEISAVIMGSTQAYSLVQGPYRTRLQIGSKPLTNEGLRLVSVKGTQAEFLEQFEATLRTMKSDGRYRQLLRKWALQQ